MWVVGFDCYMNKLTSLVGAPEEVGDFYCYENKLTSLGRGTRKSRWKFL